MSRRNRHKIYTESVNTEKEENNMTNYEIDKEIEALKNKLKQKKYMGRERVNIQDQIVELLRKKRENDSEAPKIVPSVSDETISARKAHEKSRFKTSAYMSTTSVVI